MRPPVSLRLLGFAVALAVLAPILYLGARALAGLPGAELGAREVSLLLRTLALVAAVVPTAFLLALPLAYLGALSDFRPKGVLELLGVLPLALPPYVLAYAWLAASGPGGLLAGWLGFSLPEPRGFLGAWWALSVYTAPYFFLTLKNALARLNPAPLEAARTLGVGAGTILGRVVVPMVLPAVLAGGLVAALHVLGDFGVVSLMGYETLTYALYAAYETAYDRDRAALYALVLVVLALFLLGLESRVRRAEAAGELRGRLVLPLGRLRPLAWLYLGAFSLLGLGVPVAVLLGWGVSGFARVGFAPEPLLRTLLAAAPAALLAGLVAGFLVYLAGRYPRYGVLERIVFLGYATPPIALGLALVFLALYGVPVLYQTLALLVYGYLVHFLAEAVGPVRAALAAVPRRLEEAARTLGDGPAAAFLRVVWPVLRPGVLSGGLLVFLGAIKELPLTLMLAPIGYETLAVVTWNYAVEGFFVEAAPFALLLVALGAGSTLLLYGMGRRS